MKPFLLAALSASLLVPALACENCAQTAPTAAKSAAKLPAGVQVVTLSAPSMHCAGCAAAVQTALAKQRGVQTVQADAKTKILTVTYVSAQQNAKTLIAALAKAGWAAQEVKANPKAAKA